MIEMLRSQSRVEGKIGISVGDDSLQLILQNTHIIFRQFHLSKCLIF